MVMSDEVRESKPSRARAVYGEKTIKLTVSFWTNDLAEEDGAIRPKEAWDCGTVDLQRNYLHEIDGNPSARTMFHGLHDVGPAIERAFRVAGVKLHRGRSLRSLWVVNDRLVTEETSREEGK